MTATRSVLVLQPYLPEYRRPFFDRVVARLQEMGVVVELVVGRATGGQAARSDESKLPSYARVTRTWRVVIGDRSVRWKRVRTRGADLVVSELGSGVLENYRLAVFHRKRFAGFGHGYAAASRPNRLDAALEGWQIRRAGHLFAYTDAGRDSMVRAGADPSNITVVRNTIDTAGLEAAVDAIDGSVRSAQFDRLGLDPSLPIALFVGALDESKRLGLLVEAAARVADVIPGFVLVVAGDGTARADVERLAAGTPWIRYVGRVDEHAKAACAAVASVLLIPGGVGLVAVDSFVLGLPIVTTDWPHHGPEFGYLEHGRTAIVTADDLQSYADGVIDLLSDPERLELMSAACRNERTSYRIEEMVDRFCDGVVRALDLPVRA